VNSRWIGGPAEVGLAGGEVTRHFAEGEAYVFAKRGNGGDDRNCDKGSDQSVLKRGHATAIALQAKASAFQVKPSLYNLCHFEFPSLPVTLIRRAAVPGDQLCLRQDYLLECIVQAPLEKCREM